MKKSLWFGLAFNVMIASSGFAQIPVFDAESIAKSVEQLNKMQEQYQVLQQQYAQLQQQYQSMTGSRNLGNVLNDPKLQNYLPQDWQQANQDILKQGLSGLSNEGRALYDSNKIYDGCGHLTGQSATLCQSQAAQPFQDMANAQAGFETAKSRISQLNALAAQINATQDPKSIAELQGRIAIEQALIQNEAVKMQLYAQAVDAQERIRKERSRQEYIQELDKPQPSLFRNLN